MADKGNNPITGKARKVSNGTEEGDMTEAFLAAPGRKERYELLKKSPHLQKHFRLDDYADLAEAPAAE